MKKLIPHLIHLLIAIAIFTGHFFSIDEAKHLAIAAIWFISITFFIYVIQDNKAKNQNDKKKKSPTIATLYIINLLLLFAAGWFITGIIYLTAILCVCGKAIRDKENQERTSQNDTN